MRTNISYALLMACYLILPSKGAAQKINYSDPERDDTRRTNFEIIGRVGGNFLVFKNNRNANDISVYDASMKLIDRVKQTDADDRWINVDFISYPDFAWMVYQYQRKNLVYCMAVKIDGKGKRITDPVELDTTRIGWSASNKIYSTIYSDDRKKILIFKINNRNQSNFKVTTLLYDNQLSLEQKATMDLPMEERNEYFSDFLIDNEGELFFAKFIRRAGNDHITDVSLVTKRPSDTSFTISPVNTGEHILDEIKLKVDNNNRSLLFNAFYYKLRRGNIQGLYSKIWDKATRSFKVESELVFTDDMRKIAKGPDASLRMAFDDFFITNVITRKDGGFMLISESSYTTSRGNLYDRWGNRNWNNPWLSPLDYYYWSPYFSPYSSFYWDRWNYGRGTQSGRRYHSENVFVLSFNKNGALEWNNAISKTQYDDETDALISHLIFVSGSELQVLFNLYERRTLILNNQGITPDGIINRYPTLKNLDREVEFMPRFGKQVSARSVVVPCLYRNNLIFAKIEF